MRKRMKDMKFIVKPESRKVIAIADRSEFKTVIEEVGGKYKNDVGLVLFALLTSDNNDITDVCFGEPFKGVATCDERDDFSEKIGKEIATSIVDKKYHLSMEKKYEKLQSIVLEVSKACGEMANYHSKKVNNINWDMERMYSGE